MNRQLVLPVCAIGACMMSAAFAWEPGTHGNLTKQALGQSIIAVCPANEMGCSTVLQDIGLQPYTLTSQEFPDPQSGEAIPLGPPGSAIYTAPAAADVQDLIVGGSILEDESFRPVNHFMDPVPQHTEPLNFGGVTIGTDASSWARFGNYPCNHSEVSDSQVDEYDHSFTTQCYSMQDADYYFYDALTSTKKSTRNYAYGLLFTSIGHELHLLEEMTQPQHVRNDNHCDSIDVCATLETYVYTTYGKKIPLYNPSLLEAYTFQRTAAKQSYGIYPTVTLPNEASFWSDASNTGLAQFANENFVSAGTNFHLGLGGNILPDAQYLLPAPSGSSQSQSASSVYQALGEAEPQKIQTYCDALNSPCDMDFVATDVTDSYTGGNVVNPYASTYSIFSQDLKKYGSQKLFTLNALNFEFDWDFLFPRAIGYGAGLINYFFRGRLDVQPDPSNPGGYLIINKGSYPMSGTFTLYYDDANGNRYPVPSASWSNISLAAAGNDPADEYSIQFAAPTSPAPGNPGQYMLVFQGKVGTEDGVAGKLFSAKTTYLYFYTSDADACYTLHAVPDDSSLSLTSLVQIESDCGGMGGPMLEGFAIYSGNNYTVYDQLPLVDCKGLTTENTANINGRPFATLTNSCDSPVTYAFDGIAANSKYIYVYERTINGSTSNEVGNIYVYDHSGDYIKTILNTPTQSLYYIAANDSRLCLSGYADGNVNPEEILTDLEGNVIASWPGDQFLGGYPCALTKDRLYIMTIPEEGDSVLDVYDLNGNQITSVDLTGSVVDIGGNEASDVFAVTATESNVYIAAGYIGISSNDERIIVLSRLITKNAQGVITSEKFIREPDFVIPEPSDPYQASLMMWDGVDMRDVLATQTVNR